jgi:hypothetical protein
VFVKPKRKRGNNVRKMQKDQDMLEEYDFSSGVQGKYSKI